MSDSAQVRLLRPIRYAGDIVPVDAVLSTSVSMAAELVHARKAVPHVEAPAPVVEEAAAALDQAPAADDSITDPA